MNKQQPYHGALEFPGSNHYNYQSRLMPGTVYREGDIEQNHVTIRDTRPRTTYLFKVQGCFKPTLGTSRCSSWTEQEVVTAPLLTSLRQFFHGVDLSRGLRSVLRHGEAASLLALLRR